MPNAFSTDSNYHLLMRNLLAMHQLSLAGQFESPEADAIRDAMDGPWEAFPPSLRKRLTGLSADLNAISDNLLRESPVEIDPQTPALLFAALEARQRGDWDESLELLRKLQHTLPDFAICTLRGRIWLEAGDPETADAFFEHVARINFERGDEHSDLNYALEQRDPAVAAALVAKSLRKIPAE